MRRSQQDNGLLGAYVARLTPDLYGRATTRRRIAEEMRGHLEDARDRLVESGMRPDDAERKAVEDFGSPQVVINGWAESKGIGVITNFTRYGGLAGILGVLGLTITMIAAELSWSFSIGWYAEIALTFGAFLAAGMIAVYMRLRGKLGRYARIGFKLIVAGLIIGFASSAMWFGLGGAVGIAMMVIGVALYIVGAYRSHVLPDGAFVLWAIAFVVATVVGFTGFFTGLSTEPVAAGIGYGGFALGWVWLGLHMWTESAADEPQRAATA